jgi:hypothetical protein
MDKQISIKKSLKLPIGWSFPFVDVTEFSTCTLEIYPLCNFSFLKFRWIIICQLGFWHDSMTSICTSLFCGYCTIHSYMTVDKMTQPTFLVVCWINIGDHMRLLLPDWMQLSCYQCVRISPCNKGQIWK